MADKLKLLRVVKSPKPEKKIRAVFQTPEGRIKNVDAGATGYQDYTQHHDPERRRRYIERHSARENFQKPDTAGALSRWLLWGESTSLMKNLATFRNKFNL